MKNIVWLLLFASSVSYSQKFGVKAGANFSGIDSPPVRASFLVGFYSAIPIAENIKLIPEINYSSQPYRDDELQQYVNIPVVINIYETKTLFLQLGAQYGMLLSAKQTINNQSFTVTSGRARNDFALVAGVGFDFRQWMINARYNWGLTPVIRQQDFSSNSIGQVTVGVRISGD